MRHLLPLASSTVLLTLAVACSAPPLPTSSGKHKGGTSAEDGSGQLGGGDDDTDSTAPDLAACASSKADATPRPVYLVFMFDRSLSMDDDDKWTSCQTATQTFFQSPSSAGIHASLAFFPPTSGNDDGYGYGGASCSATDYAKPAVSVTALPSTAFATALVQNSPDNGFGGGTPTQPALSGALQYAKQLQAGQAKDGSVAMVLVTDGEPQDECGSSISSVASVATQAKAANIPTYVVGVGDITALNQVAAAGGSKQAFIVNTGNPNQTQSEFSKAVDAIRASALSCDYAIPSAPAGQSFDRSKVNVQYTPSGGQASSFNYNANCTGGTGWHYDNPSAPTRILLCDGSCGTVKSSGGGVQVLFGCETKGDVVK